MHPQLTEKTFRRYVEDISDQYAALTGPVIAATAAHATALGEACMQISLDNQVDKLDWQDITARIGQMSHIKYTLLEWCNQDISPILTLNVAQRSLEGQQKLLDYAAEVAKLATQAVQVLEDYRPFTLDRLQDDLEITINLLIHTAEASTQLLASYLKQGLTDAVHQAYKPTQNQLDMQVKNLLAQRKPPA
jgi:hypothetical protein